MKLFSLISVGVFAAMTALSFSVQAADADKASESAAPAAKVKPHSHVEEKTGMPMPQSATEARTDKTEGASAPAKKSKIDKKKHYHPRDGK